MKYLQQTCTETQTQNLSFVKLIDQTFNLDLVSMVSTFQSSHLFQVVSSTKILAEYFKANCHLYELNRSNPLGMKGHIAKRFVVTSTC